MTGRYLTLLVHGESKVGKTWLGDTTPAPRLIIDAEAGGIRFTPTRKIYWNPLTEPVPVADGSWDTCIVSAGSYAILPTVFSWLNSGQHSFRSVTLDSVPEIQSKAKKDISPSGNMRIQDWGTLLSYVEDTIRQFRDLTEHPTNPLEAVVYIAGTELSDGLRRPLLQGKLRLKLPYLLDAVGYLFVARDSEGNPRRGLLIEPGGEAVAGNRLGGRLPGTVWDPNVQQMIDTVFGAGEKE